jgi:GDPmannose 4,6-dehydratase
VASIEYGITDELRVGNLDAKRDWGYAADYVEGMWRMLQQPEPDDYVLATGETHSVRELVDVAFGCIGKKWEDYVVVDERFYRPAEIYELRGDASKAKRILGWSPKTSFSELVELMVKSDLAYIKTNHQYSRLAVSSLA